MIRARSIELATVSACTCDLDGARFRRAVALHLEAARSTRDSLLTPSTTLTAWSGDVIERERRNARRNARRNGYRAARSIE